MRLQETLGQVTGLQSELTSLQTLFEKSKKEAADTKAQVDKWVTKTPRDFRILKIFVFYFIFGD